MGSNHPYYSLPELKQEEANCYGLISSLTDLTEFDDVLCPKKTPGSGDQGFEQELNLLPVGWRFAPYDFELVKDYLLRIVFGLRLPGGFVKEVDFYRHDPPQLSIYKFDFWKPNEAYFSTNTISRYPKGKQPKRTTAGGFWKASGKDHKIYYKNKVLGYKKILIFYWGKAPSNEKSNWVMHEFRLNPSVFEGYSLSDSIRSKIESCVICKLKQKKDSEKTRELRRVENTSS